MKKFRVFGVYTAAKMIGEYEAESEEEAIIAAEEDDNADIWASICHHCSHEIELNPDPHKFEAEEVE